MKTNAARLLDEANLSAESVAAKIGPPEAQVFKTLAVRGDKAGIVLALLPAGAARDLKCLAAAVCGSKRCKMLALKDVQPMTGYVRGGVSPLGTKKRFPSYLDRSALDFPEISVSAGVRGTQILPAHCFN